MVIYKTRCKICSREFEFRLNTLPYLDWMNTGDVYKIEKEPGFEQIVELYLSGNCKECNSLKIG